MGFMMGLMLVFVSRGVRASGRGLVRLEEGWVGMMIGWGLGEGGGEVSLEDLLFYSIALCTLLKCSPAVLSKMMSMSIPMSTLRIYSSFR